MCFYSSIADREEKCEQIESLKDEIDDVRQQMGKVRAENGELQQRATLANVYADELESLREKVTKQHSTSTQAQTT